jgi:hypothetical protein
MSATPITALARRTTPTPILRSLAPARHTQLAATYGGSYEALAVVRRLQGEIATAQSILEARSIELSDRQALLDGRRHALETRTFDIVTAREVAADLADLHAALAAHAKAWADLDIRAAAMHQLMDEALGHGAGLVTAQVRRLNPASV